MPSTNQCIVRWSRINDHQSLRPISLFEFAGVQERQSNFLTVTGNQYAHWIMAYTTIFSFVTTFTWLAFNDISLAFFRVQKVSLIHPNNILKCFGWDLFSLINKEWGLYKAPPCESK